MNTGDYLGKSVPGPALFVAMIAAASVMLAAGCVRAGADAGGICALETVDVKTGARTVVKSFARKIEAPNWTRDGRHLIYNSGGGRGGGAGRHRILHAVQQRPRSVLRRQVRRRKPRREGLGTVPGLRDSFRRKRRAEACHPQHALLSPRMESGRKDVRVLRYARRGSEGRCLHHPG